MPRALLTTLMLLPLPAAAWEFTPYPVCTLTHEAPPGRVSITKDPTKPVPYTIAITATHPWSGAPTFLIDYRGNTPLTIGTDQHKITPDRMTLSVSDTGFGNVIAGLKNNEFFSAKSGNTSLTFKLEGAAAPVAAFEACPTVATS